MGFLKGATSLPACPVLLAILKRKPRRIWSELLKHMLVWLTHRVGILFLPSAVRSVILMTS